MRIQYRLIALAILLAMMLTIGLAVQADSHTTLVFGLESPKSLDPATNSNDPEILFQRTIYDFLLEVGVDEMGSTVFLPNLATGWDVSEDGLTYAFNLREGVRFHDGSPFSAADVVYTFERLVELGSPANALLSDFTVVADGDSRVVFTLAGPNADFLFGASSRWSLIIQEGNTAPGTIAEDSDNPYQNFNGTGAFALTEYIPEVSATFAANEDYWQDGAPGVETLIFQFINDATTRVNALANGELDAIFKLSIPQLRELEGNDAVKTYVVPTNQHPVIRLRSDAGFAGESAQVRQAFKLATDRELLNDDLMGGAGTVGNNDPIGPVYGSFYNPLKLRMLMTPSVPVNYWPKRATRMAIRARYTWWMPSTTPIWALPCRNSGRKRVSTWKFYYARKTSTMAITSGWKLSWASPVGAPTRLHSNTSYRLMFPMVSGTRVVGATLRRMR